MARDFTFVITIICKVVRKVFGILEREKKRSMCYDIFSWRASSAAKNI